MKRINGLMHEKRKRSEFDIMADLLRVAVDGAKKSHLVYKANLNFAVIKKHLARLHEADLIRHSTQDNLYWTTPLGIEYLKHYDTLIDPFHAEPL